MKLKSHKEYTYDHILDTYNLTKDKRFIVYCSIKFNQLNLLDVLKIFDLNFEEAFLYIYNIQQELDGKMYCPSFRLLKTSDENFDDDNFYDD